MTNVWFPVCSMKTSSGFNGVQLFQHPHKKSTAREVRKGVVVIAFAQKKSKVTTIERLTAENSFI